MMIKAFSTVKLITIAIHIAVKPGGRIARTLCRFIWGTNTLKTLSIETYLCKYIYRINKYESILAITI